MLSLGRSNYLIYTNQLCNHFIRNCATQSAQVSNVKSKGAFYSEDQRELQASMKKVLF